MSYTVQPVPSQNIFLNPQQPVPPMINTPQAPQMINNLPGITFPTQQANQQLVQTVPYSPINITPQQVPGVFSPQPQPLVNNVDFVPNNTMNAQYLNNAAVAMPITERDNGNLLCEDCVQCKNCFDCKACVGCDTCYHCNNCKACTKCSGCTNTSASLDSYECSDCVNVEKCYSCSACNGCHHLINCTNCTNLAYAEGYVNNKKPN